LILDFLVRKRKVATLDLQKKEIMEGQKDPCHMGLFDVVLALLPTEESGDLIGPGTESKSMLEM
jgi:hypothetical protein